jgi:hypothetical protein
MAVDATYSSGYATPGSGRIIATVDSDISSTVPQHGALSKMGVIIPPEHRMARTRQTFPQKASLKKEASPSSQRRLFFLALLAAGDNLPAVLLAFLGTFRSNTGQLAAPATGATAEHITF